MECNRCGFQVMNLGDLANGFVLTAGWVDPVWNDEGWLSCGPDKPCHARQGLEALDLDRAWNEHQVGGLDGSNCLGAAARRRVDHHQIAISGARAVASPRLHSRWRTGPGATPDHWAGACAS